MISNGRGNLPKLALHVPEPKFRPGDAVDYSDLVISQPGAQPRPDESVAASETHPLCLDLIRVLGDDHRATGPWDPKLDAETLRPEARLDHATITEHHALTRIGRVVDVGHVAAGRIYALALRGDCLRGAVEFTK